MSVVVPLLGPLFIDQDTQVFLIGSPVATRSLVQGSLVAAYALFMLYMSPVLGRLSDQVGRRKVLWICGLGVLGANLLAGLGVEFRWLWLLFLGRILAGATSAAQVTAQAALVDRVGEARALHLSLSLLFSSLGFVIGPAIASWGAGYSLATPFYLCAGLCGVALALLLVSFHEPPRQSPPDWSAIHLSEGVRCFVDAAREPRVRGLLAAFLSMQVAWASYFLFVSIFLMQTHPLDLSLHQVGLFMGVMGAGFCIASGALQPFLARFLPMRGLAVLGLAVNAASMVACLKLTTPGAEYAAALVAGISVNLAFPSIVTMLSSRVETERQGWILGMVGSCCAAGWCISSLLSGFLGGFGHELPVALAAVLMGLSAVAMALL